MNALVARAGRLGLFGGIAGIHVSLVGLVGALQSVAAVAGVISLGTALPLLFAGVVGWRAGATNAAKQLVPTSGQALAMGALAGAISGALVGEISDRVKPLDGKTRIAVDDQPLGSRGPGRPNEP